MLELRQLLASAIQGNPEAFAQLIERFGHIVQNECRRHCGGGPLDGSISDQTQEVFLRVWTKLDQFRGDANEGVELGAFEAWLRTTARSVLLNLSRRRVAQKRSPLPGDGSVSQVADPRGSTPSSITGRREEGLRLVAAMGRCLDSASQRIVLLRVVEGRSLNEIAEQLGMTYDQVRYRFHRALDALAEYFESEETGS